VSTNLFRPDISGTSVKRQARARAKGTDLLACLAVHPSVVTLVTRQLGSNPRPGDDPLAGAQNSAAGSETAVTSLGRAGGRKTMDDDTPLPVS